MTSQPFTPGDYVRFIARIVGPRPSDRKTHDWIEPTRPRMERPNYPPHRADGYCSDALATGLIVAAVVAFLAILAWTIIS